MPETTLTLSNGKKVSLETIEIVLEAYFEKHPEEYIFQAGDVVESGDKSKRIFVQVEGKIMPVDAETGFAYYSETQQGYERCGYRKIGVLSEYIK